MLFWYKVSMEVKYIKDCFSEQEKQFIFKQTLNWTLTKSSILNKDRSGFESYYDIFSYRMVIFKKVKPIIKQPLMVQNIDTMRSWSFALDRGMERTLMN